ncbi:MAG: class I SAM-dependent methyltransferase [Acidobacteria bacterium]|nr:class I SAM-dependent methyltransferase [Acidobacteriota bacterium]MCI0568870.1 class I SAM-dependent methyltransferase [Acidobacteriota bacterium]
MSEKDSPEGRQAGGPKGVVRAAKKLGETWESRRGRRRWSNERYRMSLLLRKNLTPREDLVDVGCGPGFYVPVYLETVGSEHTYLVDQSSQMLAHCLSNYPSLKPQNLAQGAIYSLPFSSGRFNVVVNCDVLMHIPHYTQALNELFRVCNPDGGRVFLRVNLTEGRTYGDLPQGENPDPGKIYWIAYGRDEFRKALEQLGPSSIEVIDRICRKPLKRGGDSFVADAAIVVLTRGQARRALKKGSLLGHLVGKALTLGA